MKNPIVILFVLSFTLISVTTFAQYEDDNYYDKPDKKENNKSDKKIEKGISKPDETPTLKEVKEGGFDKSKISVGGNFGASFGDIIYIDLSPIVAYRPIDRVQTGIGFIYQYYNNKYYPKPYNKTNLYGGRVFSRVFVWEDLFVHAEYLLLNGEVTFEDPLSVVPYYSFRETFHTFFAGGGYNIPVTDKAYMTLQMLINLNTNLAFPERQPLFSFGFGVDL